MSSTRREEKTATPARLRAAAFAAVCVALVACVSSAQVGLANAPDLGRGFTPEAAAHDSIANGAEACGGGATSPRRPSAGRAQPGRCKGPRVATTEGRPATAMPYFP